MMPLCDAHVRLFERASVPLRVSLQGLTAAGFNGRCGFLKKKLRDGRYKVRVQVGGGVRFLSVAQKNIAVFAEDVVALCEDKAREHPLGAQCMSKARTMMDLNRRNGFGDIENVLYNPGAPECLHNMKSLPAHIAVENACCLSATDPDRARAFFKRHDSVVRSPHPGAHQDDGRDAARDRLQFRVP